MWTVRILGPPDPLVSGHPTRPWRRRENTGWAVRILFRNANHSPFVASDTAGRRKERRPDFVSGYLDGLTRLLDEAGFGAHGDVWVNSSWSRGVRRKGRGGIPKYSDGRVTLPGVPPSCPPLRTWLGLTVGQMVLPPWICQLDNAGPPNECRTCTGTRLIPCG